MNFLRKLLASRLAKHSSWYVASTMLMKVAGLLLVPVWTFYLSPEEFGVIGTIGAYCGVIAPLLFMGLPGAMVKHRIDFGDDSAEWRSYFGTIFGFIVFLCGLFVAGTFLFGESLWLRFTSGRIDYWPIVPIAVFGLVASLLGRLGQSLYQARQNAVGQITIILGVFFIATIAGLILVIHYGLGPVGFIGGGAIAHFLVGAVVLVVALRPEIGWHFSLPHLRKGLVFGLPLVPQALAAWFLSASDRVMIEHFIGLKEVGIYNLAGNLGIVMSFIAVSINRAWTPYYLKMMRDESEAARDRKTALFTGYCLTGLCAAAAGMMLFGSDVVLLLANERYAGATQFVGLIVFGYLAFGIYMLTLKPLMHKNRTGMVAIFTVVAAAMNVALNLWLIPIYGAIAAAWTTAISYFAVAVAAWILSRRCHRFDIPVASYALVLVLVIAVLAASFFVGSATLVSFGIKVAILTVVFAGFLLAVLAMRRHSAAPVADV